MTAGSVGFESETQDRCDHRIPNPAGVLCELNFVARAFGFLTPPFCQVVAKEAQKRPDGELIDSLCPVTSTAIWARVRVHGARRWDPHDLARGSRPFRTGGHDERRPAAKR